MDDTELQLNILASGMHSAKKAVIKGIIAT
jgi:hypothetical protein